MMGMMEPGSSQLASAGIMIGHQDPMMGFPKNTTFRPYAFVRNISADVVFLSPSVNYQTKGQQPQTAAPPAVELQPNQVASLFPASGIPKSVMQGMDRDFNLIITTAAAPTSLPRWLS